MTNTNTPTTAEATTAMHTMNTHNVNVPPHRQIRIRLTGCSEDIRAFAAELKDFADAKQNMDCTFEEECSFGDVGPVCALALGFTARD